jgi:hypothetical protein
MAAPAQSDPIDDDDPIHSSRERGRDCSSELTNHGPAGTLAITTSLERWTTLRPGPGADPAN